MKQAVHLACAPLKPSDEVVASVKRRHLLQGAGACALIGLGMASAARADAFPSRALRQIHPFAPGSSTDTTGRLIAQGLAQRLGQPVVVENRRGANSIVGMELAARTPADGHTLVMIYPDSVAVNPELYSSLGYDVLRDFVPLTLIGKLPLALMGRANLEVDTLADLVALSQRAPEPLTFGIWGAGSANHMLMEMLRPISGLRVRYVPFQGAAPANNALLGGHIDLTMSSAVGAAGHLKDGKLKVYAVGGARRSARMPGVPTFAELGMQAFDAATWHGIAVRAGGPAGSVERLHRDIASVLQDPDNRTKLLSNGYEDIVAMAPDRFRDFIVAEKARWGKAVRDSGVPKVQR